MRNPNIRCQSHQAMRRQQVIAKQILSPDAIESRLTSRTVSSKWTRVAPRVPASTLRVNKMPRFRSSVDRCVFISTLVFQWVMSRSRPKVLHTVHGLIVELGKQSGVRPERRRENPAADILRFSIHFLNWKRAMYSKPAPSPRASLSVLQELA